MYICVPPENLKIYVDVRMYVVHAVCGKHGLAVYVCTASSLSSELSRIRESIRVQMIM